MNLTKLIKSCGASEILSEQNMRLLGYHINDEILQAFADAITKEKDAEIELLIKRDSTHCDQHRTDVEKIDALNAKVAMMREALNKAKPVYTTAKKSSAVRKGFEQSGSIMHYTLEPYELRQSLSATEQDVAKWVNVVKADALLNHTCWNCGKLQDRSCGEQLRGEQV